MVTRGLDEDLLRLMDEKDSVMMKQDISTYTVEKNLNIKGANLLYQACQEI